MSKTRWKRRARRYQDKLMDALIVLNNRHASAWEHLGELHPNLTSDELEQLPEWRFFTHHALKVLSELCDVPGIGSFGHPECRCHKSCEDCGGTTPAEKVTDEERERRFEAVRGIWADRTDLDDIYGPIEGHNIL